MTKEETLRLALDTLKEVREETFRLMRNGERLYAEDKVWSTIITIQEALETKDEPELDCVGWFGYDTGVGAWFETNKGDDGAIPLYKDQPQRTWVGLKDDERKTICNLADADDWHDFQVMDATEAKLKEKNGY